MQNAAYQIITIATIAGRPLGRKVLGTYATEADAYAILMGLPAHVRTDARVMSLDVPFTPTEARHLRA